MVNLTINNKSIQAKAQSTILEAAEENGIYIPTLCFLKDVHKVGSCRMCCVEVEGSRTLVPSCVIPVRDGMVVHTNTKRVRDARKTIYELILSDHPRDCLHCIRNQNCELQELGEKIGLEESRITGELSSECMDVSPSITKDSAKCINCRRCITVCNQIQKVNVINMQNRGFASAVAPAFEKGLSDVNCAYCGQCTTVCPVGALTETKSVQHVWDALTNPNVTTVVQVAPAVRVALGEEFGYEPGTIVTGKIASALQQVGFDHVFDTNFSADLTILEEGTELLGRLKKVLTGEQAVLPMITSCSPGWIKFVEHNFPDQLDHLSTCKSPHTMMGALVKSYYAGIINKKPEEMFVVSIMPCTAKKFEVVRPEMQNDGCANVDAVLTTRELAQLIKQAGVDFRSLPDGKFEDPLGLSSGAADIFGTTGGVMEAALRTVYELVTGRELPFDNLHVAPIVGLDQIKTAEFKFENVLPEYSYFEGVTAKIAVTSGLEGARILMEQVKAGTSPYHFFEVMGCPGGCISGGGQPRMTTREIREKRLAAIYREDEGKTLRKSHDNPDIVKLYKEFLGEPNGHKSHELLHTHYTKR